MGSSSKYASIAIMLSVLVVCGSAAHAALLSATMMDPFAAGSSPDLFSWSGSVDATSLDFAGGTWSLDIVGSSADWVTNPDTSGATGWWWELQGLQGTFTLTDASSTDSLVSDVLVTARVDAMDGDYEMASGGSWDFAGSVTGGLWAGKPVSGGVLTGGAWFEVSGISSGLPVGPGAVTFQVVNGEFSPVPEPAVSYMMVLMLGGLAVVTGRRALTRRRQAASAT